jgi:branched-chain amino acid transport system permease protein
MAAFWHRRLSRLHARSLCRLLGRAAAGAALTAFIGILVERVLIRRLYGRDPLYSLLLTFGLAFMIEDGTRFIWGAQSLPIPIPNWLRAAEQRIFFITGYRVFMVAVVAAAVARCS